MKTSSLADSLRVWWVAPTLIYLLSRAVNLVFTLLVVPHQYVDSSKIWRGSSVDLPVNFFTLMSNWDSGIYYLIASKGYPSTLPVDAAGEVVMNEWAFYPLWPGVLRFLHEVTGLAYPLIGPLVACAMGLAALLLLVRLVRLEASPWVAKVVTLAYCFFPASLVLQTGYAEGLFMLLLAGLLLSLHRQRWGLAGLLILLMALTRPVVLAVAVALITLALVRWRRGEKTTIRPLLGLALWATATFAVWPLIAGIATGVPNAYLLTQAGWRFAGTDTILLLMLKPWVHPWVSIFYLLVGALMAACVLGLPGRRQPWPLELKAWGVGYFLYIALTIQGAIYADEAGMIGVGGEPVLHPSLWRYLFATAVPLLPLILLAPEGSSRLRKVLVLTAYVVGGLVGAYLFARYHLVDNVANGPYWP